MSAYQATKQPKNVKLTKPTNQRILFMGGYAEIMVPNPPEFEGQNWCLRVIARIEAGDDTAFVTGKDVLVKHGFNEIPNDPNRFQKFIYIDLNTAEAIVFD